jgi:predicted transcriptional regulator
LHEKYIKSLSKELSDTQVEAVKDGMTYNVLPNTYKAYQEMLPDLTKEQKKQILDYLTEAREHAMDAESSEKSMLGLENTKVKSIIIFQLKE